MARTAAPEGPQPRIARQPRVRLAIASTSREGYAAAGELGRELPADAAARLIEDLLLRDASAVLVVEPLSAWLPAVLAQLAASVTVLTADAERRQLLQDRLTDVPNATVELGPPHEGHAAAAPYDAVVVLQPRLAELPPALAAQLAPRGCAVIRPDEALPPRRLLRLCADRAGRLARCELDLHRYMPLLGDLLVAAGVVLHEEVIEALTAAAQHKRTIGEELLARGAIREDDLYRALAEQRRLPFSQTRDVVQHLDLDLVRRLPRSYLDHYRFLPVRIDDRGRVEVVTIHLELPLWELSSAFDNREIVPALTSPTDLQRIWTAIELGLVAPAAAAAAAAAVPAPPAPEAPLDEVHSRIGGMFDALLLDAVAERASDLHLEVYESGPRVRFRIDGGLHDIDRYALAGPDLVALVNVIKIAAQIDISERRAPQSGRVHRRAAGRVFDLRVQTQPCLHGEHLVIRILPQDQSPPALADIGFPDAIASHYRRLLHEPNGLVLVVGPTGSGKSTTLYAGLRLLAGDSSRKVITIEDPIEYSIPRVQQSQVNPVVGFHFASAVRTFVREDPDVILVGEIRDAETALEAVRASQTGHLVLSTMHCNDAVDAAQRLLDLGLHPNSVASELTAVFAQRLSRRICVSCKQEAAPDPELMHELFAGVVPADFRCFSGRGCARCGGTGTRGRVAVVEFLRVGPTIRKAISRRMLLDELRELAQQNGLVSLRDSALELVRQGTIPLAELYDVLSAEQMAPPQTSAPPTRR